MEGNLKLSDSPQTFTVNELEQKARDLLDSQFGSILQIPIDIDLIIERTPNVDLDYWPGLRPNHGVAGMVLRDKDSGIMYVMIDDRIADREPTYYRMTAAEEFGHIVLHKNLIDQIDSAEKFHELQTHELWHKMERNAKRFAAALLMPPAEVTSRVEGLYPELVKEAGFDNPEAILKQLAIMLAKEFVVSTTTMIYRFDEWQLQVKERVECAIQDRVDFLA